MGRRSSNLLAEPPSFVGSEYSVHDGVAVGGVVEQGCVGGAVRVVVFVLPSGVPFAPVSEVASLDERDDVAVGAEHFCDGVDVVQLEFLVLGVEQRVAVRGFAFACQPVQGAGLVIAGPEHHLETLGLASP